MHPPIHHARSLPFVVELGLHIQHGGERRCRNTGQHSLEWVQLRAVQEDREDMGGAAWYLRSLDHLSNEPGAHGFCALEGYDRCTQSVASGNRGPYPPLVQVSHPSCQRIQTHQADHNSFLVKDAQEDIAGTRLKQ